MTRRDKIRQWRIGPGLPTPLERGMLYHHEGLRRMAILILQDEAYTDDGTRPGFKPKKTELAGELNLGIGGKIVTWCQQSRWISVPELGEDLMLGRTAKVFHLGPVEALRRSRPAHWDRERLYIRSKNDGLPDLYTPDTELDKALVTTFSTIRPKDNSYEAPLVRLFSARLGHIARTVGVGIETQLEASLRIHGVN
jgi:hypothetical protein